jgi:RHH-type rel operon transcriptional repressor/antitoxin RelB
MASAPLRLPEEVSGRLQWLADLTGASTTYFMIETISEHLGDLED